MKTVISSLMLLAVCAGCSSTPSYNDIQDSMLYRESSNIISDSLFPSDQTIISSEAIGKILDGQIQLPEQARLAIYRMGQRNDWVWWSDEFARLDENIKEKFINQLERCDRLKTVRLLPSLITPEKQSVPLLRESAARFQADLMLIYRMESRTYDKSRFFKPDEAKTVCTVEAILLDTRTGIVPFATVVKQEYTATRTREDYGLQETIARAEMQAVSKALGSIAGDLVQFLDSY